MSRGAAQTELVVSLRQRAATRWFLPGEARGFLDFILIPGDPCPHR